MNMKWSYYSTFWVPAGARTCPPSRVSVAN